MKETDRIIGDLGNRFGELAEHLVAPSIKEKFRALNFYFDHISHDHEISDNGHVLKTDAKNDKCKYQGAIAGAIMSDSVRNYAHKAGFYVIEQTGDTVKINIPEGFIARVW